MFRPILHMKFRSSCFVRFLLALLVLSMCSCSSAPVQTGPIVDLTADEIKSSTDLGWLRSMQVTLLSVLSGKQAADHESEFSLLEDINQRIADLHKQRLERQLESKKISVEPGLPRVTPLPTIIQLADMVRADQSITPAHTADVLSPLQRERLKTQKVIDEFVQETSQEKLGMRRRATVYNNLFILSGDNHWRDAREKQMKVVLDLISKSIEHGSRSASLESKVDFVRTIYKDEPLQLVEEMLFAYASIYSNRYFYHLDRNDPDGAYGVIEDLSKKSDFELISKRLAIQIPRMLEQYLLLLNNSIAQPDNLPQSYRWYVKYTQMGQILGHTVQGAEQAKILASQLHKHYDHLKSEREYTSALGVLYALYTINPNYPNLISEFSQLEADIFQTALPTLKIHPLKSRSDEKAVGQAVAQSLVEHLEASIPQDIKIVSSDKPKEEAPPSPELPSLILEGNILQVKVNRTQKATKKNLNVNVGEMNVPNPDYIAWLKLPYKEREATEKPPETRSVERYEDIAIGSVLHQKTGVFAASFRLMDESGNVLYPDSITLQKDYQDDSNSVFEVGQVVIPAKKAKLPSDEDIYSEMIGDIATKMGENLAAELSNRELNYVAQADKAVARQDCQQEIDSLAKAIAILRAKGKDIDSISSRLRDRSIACLWSPIGQNPLVFQ